MNQVKIDASVKLALHFILHSLESESEHDAANKGDKSSERVYAFFSDLSKNFNVLLYCYIIS